jgi:hypothetical protein
MPPHRLRRDPDQISDVAGDQGYAGALAKMRAELLAWMGRTGDPRAGGETDIWDAGCWHQQPKADIKMPGYDDLEPGK